MNPHTLFDVACYGIGLLGGPALFIGPFTARGRNAPHWMRVALWLLCPIALGWSLLGFALLLTTEMSRHAYYVIDHTKALFAGMGIGIGMLLFVSGGFIAAFSKPKKRYP